MSSKNRSWEWLYSKTFRTAIPTSAFNFVELFFMLVKLSMADLNDVYNECFKYRASWYDIGLMLGLDDSDLEAIKKDNHHASEECLRVMLTFWLRQDGTRRLGDIHKAINQIKFRMVSQAGPEGLPINASLRLSCLMLKVGSVIILFVLLLWQNVWSAHRQDSPISHEAAGILREIYKNSPVIQFDLLRSESHHMPVLEVIMKNRHRDQELSVNELLREHSGQSGRLLITGQPGSGKTTLMRYLAKEWAKGRVLRSCQILFLIYLGSLKRDVEINSLTSLLRASPYEDLDFLSVSKEIRKGHGVGACFLLDAYDEWKSDKKNFVHNMIFHNELHSSLVVCTSRLFNYEDSVDFDIIGFPFKHLNSYLHKMSNDTKLIRSIEQLWKSNRKIKEMCTLPLHMAMVLFVTKRGVTIASHVTTTRIYLSFMNATIIHYPEMYNEDCTTDYFWRCIRSSHGDRELCIAFQYLHKTAFRMRLKNEVAFEKNSSLQQSINKLGFVGAVLVDGSEASGVIVSSKVKYVFSHQTFLDFFAALHLTTLSRQEQLMHIMLYQDDYKFSMLWKFYFGLIGDVYYHNVSFISPFLRQYSAYTYSIHEVLNICSTIVHSQKYLMAHEIGWSGKVYRELLESAELVVNSTLCIQCIYAYDEHGPHSTSYCPPNSQLIGNWNFFVLVESEMGWILLKASPDQALNEEYIWKLYFCIYHGFKNNRSNCTEVNFTPVHSIRLHQIDTEGSNDIHHLNNLMKVSPNLDFVQVDFNLVTYTKKSIHFDILNSNHSLKHVAVGVKPIVLEVLGVFLNVGVSELTLTYDIVTRLTDYKLRSPLSQILKDPSALHRLSIKDICYSEPTLTMLLSGLTELHYVSIHSQCVLHAADIKAIYKSFVDNDNLFVIELKLDEWRSDLNAVFEYLPYGLKELYIKSKNQLLDTDIAHLSKELHVLDDLTTLTLKSSHITGAGIESLTNGLKSLQFFYSLDLSDSPISECENGIAAFAQLTTLKSLSITLSSNNDIQLLVNALLSNKNLHTLVLRLDDESDINPLARLKHLKHLYLYIEYDVDKDSVLNIIENLTLLKTLELISNCSGWSEEDIFEVTFKAFQISLESGHICNRRRSRHYFEPASTDD